MLWPASKRIWVARGGLSGDARPRETEVTLVLNSATLDPPAKPLLPQPPKPPPIDPPDDMGEATGKGTGVQAAKGDTPLKAPQADQDQPFISRDPSGQGRVGDRPTMYTGPRGEDGRGGQRGGPRMAPAVSEQSAAMAPTPRPAQASPDETPSPPKPAAKSDTTAGETAQAAPSPESTADAPVTSAHKSQEQKPPEIPQNQPPRESVVHAPTEAPPGVKPPTDIAPPASPQASIGAAAADLNKPAAEAVRPTGPLAQVATLDQGTMSAAPEEGPSVAPKPATGTAPPTPAAPAEHPSVVVASALALPPAPVATPPLPAVQPAPGKPKTSDLMDPATPAPPPASPALAPPAPSPVLVATGDGHAPGQARASADPAQQSDSETDPFREKEISAIIHDGKLEVRHGRKVKTTRPHFLPGAAGAFMANPNPTIVLKISIDPTGAVKDVDIIRSTGSVEIDQPIRVSIYDWWFEPTHDRKGRPVADVVVFTIHFR